MKRLIKVGLTGGYGSGKSFVSGILAARGCAVIDADFLAHQVVEPKRQAWKGIVGHFGKEILEQGGWIDRKKLSEIVFSNKAELIYLNSVIHPAVIREIKMEIKLLSKKEGARIVVVSAPLLIEAGMAGMFDKIIVIKVKKEVQLKRCIESKGETIPAVKRRIKAQMPLKEKLKYADFVIDNNGLPKETEKQVINILNTIKS